jgi:hypothetical protein
VADARGRADDDGHYPALADLYHHLSVGPCTREEIDAWADHPWVSEIRFSQPGWHCDYATWVAEFRDSLPATPFALPEEGLVSAEVGGDLPEDVHAERYGDAWVIRDGRGDFWCDALANCWSPDADDEIPALTFSSRDAAEAAYRAADRMYGARAARHEAALARLDQLGATDGRPEE